MTINKVLVKAKQILKCANVENCDFCATTLLAHSLACDKVALLRQDVDVSPLVQNNYFKLIDRRASGEPLQYILKSWEFMSLDFKLNPQVLIPRSETEILVESVLARCGSGAKILDIGTGSGCIVISLVKTLAGAARAQATDVSQSALEVAKSNAITHNVSNQINFIKHDILKYSINFGDNFDVIVSNPPYIKSDTIKHLQKEVSEYEPHIALDGGSDGLLFYKQIIYKVKKAKKAKNGFLALEVGAGQSQEVISIMKRNNFKKIEIIQDYSGINRVVIGFW